MIFPDLVGKKNTMAVVMPLNIISQAMIVFSDDFFIKGLGFFITGFIHLRITISFTHCLELMPESHKSVATTFINVFDQGGIVFAGLYLHFVSNKVDPLFRFMFYLGVVATILYFALIPESPRWLFSRDPNSQRGIRNLNYIARFNGSKLRVPENAIMDVVG
jgi:MFS family permease